MKRTQSVRIATWIVAFLAPVLTGVIGCGTETTTEVVDGPAIVVAGDWVVKVGENITLTATTKHGTDASYTWSSSDETVATVDADGAVTGVAEGVAVITVKGADTGVEATRGVVVEADTLPTGAPVVIVSGDYALDVGATLTLTAATENGEDASYTWASSDEAVATVDAGVVTGVAEGVAEITATGADSGKVGKHGVVVTMDVPAATPTVGVEGEFVVGIGMQVTLTATTHNGADSGYTWITSDATIATVDEGGVVTGLAKGEVVVTATGADTAAAGKIGMVVTEDPLIPPFFDEWASSGHADKSAEAFKHWDEDGEISTSCAKCHSEGGFLDFIGADGSEAGVVDKPAAIGTTVTCAACHNAATLELDTVTFPSGEVVTGLGSEARCMQCHQGRSSTVSVDNKIADAMAEAAPDTVSAELSFQNIHYLAAGATLYGGIAKGGYQYADKSYDGRNRHVDERDTCLECHNQHTLEVRIDRCAECHTKVEGVDDLVDVRMYGSTGDYDGDGNTTEGMKHELEGLAPQLMAALQAYATQKAGAPIVYSSAAYPYFFGDTNANGTADEDEVAYANAYKSWTPRSLKGAYNYQYYLKDPGAYAHNPKYVVQLMHDSIVDLASATDTPVVFEGDRSDAGHFAGSNESWQHWNEDGEVSASCSRCHTGSGFVFYTDFGVSAPQPPSNGLTCLTCHKSVPGFEIREVKSATFPSGKVLSMPKDVDNLCTNCHSGRTAKATIDQAIVDDKLGFKNVHYLAAAATLFGTDAEVGYEYDGKTYAGMWQHTGGNSCTGCHSPEATEHTFDINDNSDTCAVCHGGSTDFHAYRLKSLADYDGDNDATENLSDEIATLGADLYAQIQAAASANGAGIVYESHAYPYFFLDKNDNGVADPDEANYGNSYKAWTPALMKAAHNYQHSLKETGAWAHNFAYIAQLLIDSIEDLGGDVTKYTRP